MRRAGILMPISSLFLSILAFRLVRCVSLFICIVMDIFRKSDHLHLDTIVFQEAGQNICIDQVYNSHTTAVRRPFHNDTSR